MWDACRHNDVRYWACLALDSKSKNGEFKKRREEVAFITPCKEKWGKEQMIPLKALCVGRCLEEVAAPAAVQDSRIASDCLQVPHSQQGFQKKKAESAASIAHSLYLLSCSCAPGPATQAILSRYAIAQLLVMGHNGLLFHRPSVTSFLKGRVQS